MERLSIVEANTPPVPAWDTLEEIPCKFYLRGLCSKGDSCRYAHVAPRWSDEDEGCAGSSLPCSSGSRARVGDTVSLVGLKAAPELNGCGGVVKSFDAATQRFRIQLASGSFKCAKGANVEYPARCHKCNGEITSGQCFECI